MNPENVNAAPLARTAGSIDLAKHWAIQFWESKQNRTATYWVVGILLCWFLLAKFLNAGDSEKNHIRRVIQQDKAVAREMEKKMGFKEKYWNASKVVAELAEKMDAIDLNGCPQDFQAAYKKHVAAWKSKAYFESSNTGMEGTLKNFITGGLLTPSIFSEGDSISKEVNATFAEVKQVAIRHGVVP